MRCCIFLEQNDTILQQFQLFAAKSWPDLILQQWAVISATDRGTNWHRMVEHKSFRLKNLTYMIDSTPWLQLAIFFLGDILAHHSAFCHFTDIWAHHSAFCHFSDIWACHSAFSHFSDIWAHHSAFCHFSDIWAHHSALCHFSDIWPHHSACCHFSDIWARHLAFCHFSDIWARHSAFCDFSDIWARHSAFCDFSDIWTRHSAFCHFSWGSNECVRDSSTVKMWSRNALSSFLQCCRWMTVRKTCMALWSSLSTCGIHFAQTFHSPICWSGYSKHLLESYWLL